ncbi:hypothetical protein [Phytohalomonas tamaricis]|nr:hypothetical protein [Phytohalomonas tamaricis]
MSTQNTSTARTNDVQVSLLKRANRMLMRMSENAYQGYQAQLVKQYGTL